MREIPLTQGRITVVDDEDLDWLSQWRWCWTKNHDGGIGYATRNIWAGRGRNNRGKRILMHRVILDAPPGMQVDHINGDTLDNRRCNLRPCRPAQNQHNMKKPRTRASKSSKYKGVYWNKKDGKWQAQIGADGKHIYLGRYTVEEEAAHAYNKAASNYFGDFARLNDIPL